MTTTTLPPPPPPPSPPLEDGKKLRSNLEEIINDVRGKLSSYFTIDELERQTFIRQFSNHVKNTLKIDLTTAPSVFNIPFITANHLTKCQLVEKRGGVGYNNNNNNDGGENRIQFPLHRMHCPELHMFYKKERAPNLAVFLPGKRPSALFTKHGYLTLAGGRTEQEIAECVLLCIIRLIIVLYKIYPQKRFTVDSFRLCNLVASTTIVHHKIYLAGFIDYIRSYKIGASFNQESINFCFVKYLLPFRPSITFCVSATGAVNLMGCKNKYEAKYVIALFSYFIKGFLVLDKQKPPITKKILSLYLQEMLKHKQETGKQKLLDKKSLIQDHWISTAITSTNTPLPPPLKKKRKVS
jgi:hypothetical protein